jgi:hypothetical protein
MTSRSSVSTEPSALDAWARQHPWHPRVGPWFAYMVLLSAALLGRDWQSWTYVPLKLIQVAVVCWLIWRWRGLVKEINWRFHWSVVPVSIALTGAWIYLNGVMIALFPGLGDSEPTFFEMLYVESTALFWLAAGAHLLAMCTAVPMIEETFNRSVLLRSLHDARKTGTGLLQLLCDMPLIGDWLMHTQAGTRATREPPVFGEQFEKTPLGQLSVFGIAASTGVFMLVHAMRDWPGAIVCGITWCVMLNRTRHLGLGPIIWSHALVNALLWGHVMYWHEWRFM